MVRDYIIRHGTYDHLVDDSRRPRRNVISTNRSGGSTAQYCPECKQHKGRLINLVFYKDLPAYMCTNCRYTRYVDPVSRKEIAPGTTSDPGIPTLDGLTDQNVERSSRPMVRSIGDARARSQYASNRRFRDNGMQIDRETREMAERMGASVTAYREILPPQDNKTVTSKERTT
jgi:ssDNA-binding Zn-finger/Zn-ribbon topoisomerase 1